MSNDAWQTASQVAILIGSLIVAAGVFGVAHFRRVAEREKSARAAMTGKLEPSKLEPSKQMLLDPANAVYPSVQFGKTNGGIILAGPNAGSSEIALFKFGGDNDLQIGAKNGRISVSATIRDATGAVITELIDNEWKVNASRAWDRNYSDEALEVLDGNGDVILQIRLANERVQFLGKLRARDGAGLSIYEMPDPNGGARRPSARLDFVPPGQPLPGVIARIFRYPSDRHLGEYVAPLPPLGAFPSTP